MTNYNASVANSKSGSNKMTELVFVCPQSSVKCSYKDFMTAITDAAINVVKT